ncbi:MAG TPA: ABC transporter permease [Vicinamibacterales bacterium]|nr:ABC transporter permease [Vicinamibacterales bacterium]
MSTLWRELRLAARTATKSPMYSAIAVATLALAIGANTLLFSIASPLAIRPLPIERADRLGWIWQSNAPSAIDRAPSSIAELMDFRASATIFSALGGMEQSAGTLTGHGDAQHVGLARVTANFGDLWGLHAVAGRLLQTGEDAVGRPLSGVLSHRYWQKSFRGDPGVVGRTFTLDGQPITIVGVMEPEIEMGTLAQIDLWVPLPLDPAVPRDQRTVRIIGRLAPGATLASADAEIHGIATRLAAAHPDTNLNWDAHVVSTKQAIVGTNTWVIISLLSVVVIFVLLIACANLANLVLARVVARRHDFAVRLALGASRLQVIRPLLFENLLLGLAGGLAGLAIARAGLRVINATATDVDPYLKQVAIDGYVLAFAIVLSVITPFIFSLWPAIGASRVATAETLRDARSSGGPRARWQRNLLVGSQVALALSLLVVSALVLQTMQNIHEVHVGLDINRVLCFDVSLPPNQYRGAVARDEFAREAAARLARIPGVDAAAVVSQMPVFNEDVVRSLSGTRHDGATEAERPWAAWFAASPDLFRVAGIPLLAGRAFLPSDTADAPPVAVVSQMTAEKYFDDVTSAVGRTVTMHGRGTADRTVTIVGVVADTKNSQAIKTSPQIWVPFTQAPLESMTFAIRSVDPAARAQDAQAVMRGLNPDVAISAPVTLTKMVQDVLADDSILTGLFLGFAMLALALAAAGLYGVISYSVGQRQREIGVRLALGAAPSAIRRMVLGDGLKVTAAGVVVGLGLAALLAQGTSSFLYGITPNDVRTFAAVTATLLVVALVAVWNPAARAMRVDPVKALRND